MPLIAAITPRIYASFRCCLERQMYTTAIFFDAISPSFTTILRCYHAAIDALLSASLPLITIAAFFAAVITPGFANNGMVNVVIPTGASQGQVSQHNNHNKNVTTAAMSSFEAARPLVSQYELPSMLMITLSCCHLSMRESSSRHCRQQPSRF